MPEIVFEVPPAAFIPELGPSPASVRGAPIKWVSLAAVVSGALAYGSPPDPDDWQKWSNKLFRHWLWHEAHRRRRRHFPNAYTDSGHAPIH